MRERGRGQGGRERGGWGEGEKEEGEDLFVCMSWFAWPLSQTVMKFALFLQ